MNTLVDNTNPTNQPRTIKSMLAGDKRVHFLHYVKGDLWYATECGFEFPVPIADVGDATLLSSDRAMLFMRYVRKHMEHLAAEQLMISQARVQHEAEMRERETA